MRASVILPVHSSSVKAAMLQHRLRILRPSVLDEELAAALHTLPAPRLAADSLDVIDAHLACGDFAAILRLLREADPHPALPLALARFVRWSGDLKTAAAVWNAVLLSLDITSDESARPGLRRTTALELAPLATDLGYAQLAARLLGVARTADEAELAGALDSPAALIRRVAFHSLGIEPDAVRGRLRLRPRLDLHPELHVQNIPFGDSSIRMTASVRDRTVEVRVEQEAGGIPVTLLLEPLLPPALAAHLRATVDGQPAELEPRAVEDGIVVPVQLVLDDERILVLNAETPDS